MYQYATLLHLTHAFLNYKIVTLIITRQLEKITIFNEDRSIPVAIKGRQMTPRIINTYDKEITYL